MYKILHLFRDSVFVSGYIEFVNTNFKDNYHEFWIYGRSLEGKNHLPLFYGNVKRVMNIDVKLEAKKINEFDKIIYHGVFDYDIIDFFSKHRNILRKLYLYFWGGDKIYIRDNKKYNIKKKYVVQNAYGIINILPEEKRYIQKYYHSRGRFFTASYGGSIDVKAWDNRRKQHVGKDVVAIQVGNSATSTNHHIYILNLLSKFKNENIKIYAPLSYGDMRYAEQVIKEGERIFGEKFTALTEYLDADEYSSFLNHIDIGIFDMKRQQALGNIIQLLYLGKKVYLRDNAVLFHYYKIRNNCDVFITDDISKIRYDEFIFLSEEAKKNNEYKVKNLFLTKSLIIRDWNRIFND